METALEQSVNTYFYQLSMDLGIDRMHDYLAQFGFGVQTGIDAPGESKGLLPSREWKRTAHEEPWYPGETVIAGIGQGFNVVTPVQLSNAVATLINGGQRYQPRLVYAIKRAGDARAKRERAPMVYEVPVKNPDHWQLVLEGMDRVVNGPMGTARSIGIDARPVTGRQENPERRRFTNWEQVKSTRQMTSHSTCVIMPFLWLLHPWRRRGLP
jgi:penicillin-binding protein 2